MLLPLVMPLFSFLALFPFLLGRIDNPVARKLLSAVLLTFGVIGFSVLIAVVDQKGLLGLVASASIVVVLLSTAIARHHNPYLRK